MDYKIEFLKPVSVTSATGFVNEGVTTCTRRDADSIEDAIAGAKALSSDVEIRSITLLEAA